MQAEVKSIGRADGIWHTVEVDGRRLAEFRNEDDANIWCRLWNEREDPNGWLEDMLEVS